MAPRHIILFIVLSLCRYTELLSSTHIYHTITPALRQQASECGLHALYNAYCFITETAYLDADAFKKFRTQHIKMYGKIPRFGIYFEELHDMRSQLIPPDDNNSCVLILFKSNRHDGPFDSPHDLLSKIIWFYRTPGPTKLSIILLHRYHYNTFNFYKNHAKAVTIEVADSDLIESNAHKQAFMLKELISQGHYLADVTYKQLMAQKKRPLGHKKRRGWVKIAYFNNISGSGLSQKKPFRATFNLY